MMIGSGIGGLQHHRRDRDRSLEESGPRRVSPFFIPSALINLARGQVSISYGFKGPNHAVVTACSTGAHAIGDAARLIVLDDADVMVAGGAEAAVCRLGMAGFAAARALSTGFNDDAASGPRAPGTRTATASSWARAPASSCSRSTSTPSARGAKIYAEVDRLRHVRRRLPHHRPARDGDGGFRSMQRGAEARRRSTPDEIDYINAHGTSTPLGDEIELGAVKRLFGDAAAKARRCPRPSRRSATCWAPPARSRRSSRILAIRDQVVPPTLNLDNPSRRLRDIDLVPPTRPRSGRCEAALSNSFGFGGTNASVDLHAPRPDA